MQLCSCNGCRAGMARACCAALLALLRLCHPALLRLQLAEAEKEQKRMAFEKALALPDEKPVSDEASALGLGCIEHHRAV